jgi:hypothetical protein
MPFIIRERLHIIPGILWLNFTKNGVDVNVCASGVVDVEQ